MEDENNYFDEYLILKKLNFKKRNIHLIIKKLVENFFKYIFRNKNI